MSGRLSKNLHHIVFWVQAKMFRLLIADGPIPWVSCGTLLWLHPLLPKTKDTKPERGPLEEHELWLIQPFDSPWGGRPM